jgi:hypothetical protein
MEKTPENVRFFCLTCGDKYTEVAKKVPNALLQKKKCAECGRTDLGYDYYAGTTPIPARKQKSRGRRGAQRYG